MTIGTLLTAGAVCDRYQISARTLERWVKAATHPFPAPIKLRKRRYWPADALAKWEAQTAETETEDHKKQSSEE